MRLKRILCAGKVSAPPKPVELTINTTKIGEFFDGLLNLTSPPPPSTPFTPPAPSPAPGPSPPLYNFTVPNANFAPPSPVTISGTNLVDPTGDIVTLNVRQLYSYSSALLAVLSFKDLQCHASFVGPCVIDLDSTWASIKH